MRSAKCGFCLVQYRGGWRDILIRLVKNQRQLRQFVLFPKKLYHQHPVYVYPIFTILYRELKQEVLKKRNYRALLAIQDGAVVGRILYTIAESKQRHSKIGYFSYFDVIDQDSIAKELFETMEEDLITQGITYVEGTFTPYDPDNKRGILVQGFEYPQTIFTSYNHAYYMRLLTASNYQKAFDTITIDLKRTPENIPKLLLLDRYFTSRHQNIRVDSLNLKNLNQDLTDIHQILQIATTEVIYQDAPSMEMITKVAKDLKRLIRPELVKIAREIDTQKPIGFCLVLPDFNQVFQKTKGRLLSIHLLRAKRIITRTRGVLQYVIPEYQNTGLLAYIFKKIYDEFERFGIFEFEAGTMMEDNHKAHAAFLKLGGQVTKIYRIYGKELQP